MYIHTSMYIIERSRDDDKDIFARMAQSIIDGKNYGQTTLPEKGLSWLYSE
jgi:hypothetical protein